MTQNSLITKALKLSKQILFDPEVSLTNKEKKAYKDFESSNGWVDRFKKRYKIAQRFITTKCTKNIDDMKISLQASFTDLNNTILEKTPTLLYNMDEVGIFFELSRDRTLEIKGKKVVGKFSSGKDKERVTLIITVSSDGYLLPPFLIFKASKPRSKIFKDFPTKEEMEFKDEETKRLISRNKSRLI